MKAGQKAKKRISDIIHTKVGKYFMAVQKGVSKAEAQRRAGYRQDNKSTSIERTGEYQALQEHFGVNLQKHITVNEINGYLADNIRQEGEKKVDRHARNKAIEIAKNMIEPDGDKRDDTGDRVLIVLGK